MAIIKEEMVSIPFKFKVGVVFSSRMKTFDSYIVVVQPA